MHIRQMRTGQDEARVDWTQKMAEKEQAGQVRRTMYKSYIIEQDGTG